MKNSTGVCSSWFALCSWGVSPPPLFSHEKETITFENILCLLALQLKAVIW
ncbi:hypothetical protein JHK82_016179 [Glycine max]|nr:hypothetical protein JHK86_016209 [Glycine max]KAG5149298.1 hypothetical protein JHK82_016179 [Glycine max]